MYAGLTWQSRLQALVTQSSPTRLADPPSPMDVTSEWSWCCGRCSTSSLSKCELGSSPRAGPARRRYPGCLQDKEERWRGNFAKGRRNFFLLITQPITGWQSGNCWGLVDFTDNFWHHYPLHRRAIDAVRLVKVNFRYEIWPAGVH